VVPGLGFICVVVSVRCSGWHPVATDLALAARRQGDVDEAVGVGEALLRTALGSLLLLLGLDLGSLRLDFAL
jgi:hypothetical protein